MTQLKTTFAGLSLRNPIIISSSSLTNSAEKNKKLELAGAGAIVLKSVFEEQIMMEAHHMATYGSPEGDDYLSTYVRSHALNEYISLIEQTKKLCTIPVIASINCFSNSEWTDFARTVEAAGADALEINILSLQTEKEYQYGSFRTASYRYRKQYQETDFHPRHCETGQQSDQPHRTDQPALCQRSQCCGIVQPILPAGYQYRHHDIFCRRCIQYSCRLVQRTALDCYRFGTSSSDRLCHFGRCARWKSDSQSNSGRRFGCRTVQCHLPKRQSGHCRYDK
jgi:hypothetical protein